MILFGRDIDKEPPLIVAEIGASHNGVYEHATKLIERAKFNGADAVKVQCYDPESLTIQCDKPEFNVQNPLWKGTLWDLYHMARTPISWMPLLFDYAEKVSIPIFASVFCERGLEMLKAVGNPVYKIASMEITDIPLIAKVAQTGKPIILSTGMADLHEIDRAVDAAAGAEGIGLLHCVSGYPTPIGEANLPRMEILKSVLDVSFVGLSDHTRGIEAPIAATALGARMIEKHLGLGDRTPDSEFSLTPEEFHKMAAGVRNAWAAMQHSKPKSEKTSRQLRRSLYAVEDIRAGEEFSKENVRSIRPGYGLEPGWLAHVLGRQAAQDIERGTPLTFDMLLS